MEASRIHKLSVFTNCTAIGIFQTLKWSHGLPWRTTRPWMDSGHSPAIDGLSHPQMDLQHRAPGLLQWDGSWDHPFSTISIGQCFNKFQIWLNNSSLSSFPFWMPFSAWTFPLTSFFVICSLSYLYGYVLYINPQYNHFCFLLFISQ